jgi:hypothetical protein
MSVFMIQPMSGIVGGPDWVTMMSWQPEATSIAALASASVSGRR